MKSLEDTAEFTRLFVKDAHRKKGHGRRLIEAIVSAAQAKNIDSISCLVHRKNVGAQAFYRRLGFFVANHDGDDKIMVLQISS